MEWARGDDCEREISDIESHFITQSPSRAHLLFSSVLSHSLSLQLSFEAFITLSLRLFCQKSFKCFNSLTHIALSFLLLFLLFFSLILSPFLSPPLFEMETNPLSKSFFFFFTCCPIIVFTLYRCFHLKILFHLSIFYSFSQTVFCKLISSSPQTHLWHLL